MNEPLFALMMIIAGMAILFANKKNKREPEYMVIETWEVTAKKRPSSGLVNLLVVAAIIFFIWAMNH